MRAPMSCSPQNCAVGDRLSSWKGTVHDGTIGVTTGPKRRSSPGNPQELPNTGPPHDGTEPPYSGRSGSPWRDEPSRS